MKTVLTPMDREKIPGTVRDHTVRTVGQQNFLILHTLTMFFLKVLEKETAMESEGQ